MPPCGRIGLPVTQRTAQLLVFSLALAGSCTFAQAQSATGLRRTLGSQTSQTTASTAAPEELYGNPSGSGAGVTGYQSKKKRKATKKPATTTAKASAGPSRRGASTAVETQPEATGSLPVRRRPPAEDDPYAATGLRAGAFILYPAIELMGGSNSNPAQAPGGRSASLMTTSPELRFQSDWSRHELKGEIRATHTAYVSGRYDNTFTLNALIDGRLDIQRDWRAEMQLRSAMAPESLSSPNLASGVTQAPQVYSNGATAGIVRSFGRAEYGLRGMIDRVDYGETKYATGRIDRNTDRNYAQPALALRGSYEVSPGIKPFVEASIDRRIYDQNRDDFGYQRSSNGATGKIGSSFELSQKLKGEIAIGVTRRSYDDNRLKELNGLVADSSLIWSATALTNITLGARSTVEESTTIGVSGLLRREVDVKIDHAFQRELIATAKVGFGYDTYQGSTREDERLSTTLGLTYKLTRTVQIKGEWRHDRLKSNTPGVDYTADTLLAGLRLQR